MNNETRVVGVNGFKRSVKRQFVLGLLTNFTNIAPSMSLGFSAIALPALKTGAYALDPSQASWFASIASLATPFGCFFSGPIADRFGRRMAIFCVNVICFLGWLTIASAYYLKDYQYPILLVGRLLTGLSTGLSSVPVTVYMAEISSPKLRGVFTTWSTISFAIGVLIVYFLGFLLKDYWGTISLITAVLPCVAVLLNVLFIPESPSWLVSKGRYDEAKTNMCNIFGTEEYIPEVEEEMNALIKSKGVKTNTERSTIPEQLKKKIKHLLKPSCLKPFFLILLFFFFQQFSGTFSIVFYAIDIVENAGVATDSYITIVLIAVVRAVSAIILSYISKKFGRRPLSIFSGIGMSVCMCILGGYILLIQQGKVSADIQDKLSFLPLLLLLLYFMTSTLGFLPLPFAMAAEVFPLKIRGTATGLISSLAYFFNFITVKIYPNMVASMYSQGVFFFYGSVAFVGTLFVIFFLPETRGKSLQEIQDYFDSGRKKKEVERQSFVP